MPRRWRAESLAVAVAVVADAEVPELDAEANAAERALSSVAAEWLLQFFFEDARV